ncbi:MAG: hypothetical protein ACI3ZB_11890 [Prevotella sp.]
MAILFLPSNAWARTDVTFDFAGNPWGLTLGSGSGETAEAGNVTAPIVQDEVSLSFDQGTATTPVRMWTGPQLRAYNGNTLTFTAPEGKVIEKIEFTATGASYFGLSADNGTIDASIYTWTQPAEQVHAVIFTVTKSNRLTKAVVTIAAPGEAPEAVVLPTAENIAAFKALDTDTEAELTLTDAKVLHVNGDDMIVEDATGAIDFYKIGLTATAGQVLNGTIAGKKSVYNGLPELTKSSNTDVATVSVSDGDAPVAVEMTVADAMAETSYLKYVKLTDATLEVKDGTYYLVNGDNEIQIYNKFGLDYTLPEAIKSFAGIIIPYKKGDADLIVEIAPIAVEDIVAVEPIPEGDITSLILPNPGFEECEANTENLKTASAAGVDYTAQGWTITASGSYCNAAAFEYGSAATLNDCIAPAADNAGNSGKTMGVTVAWSSNVKYTTASPITFPAGVYTVKINGYNSFGSATLFHSNFAVVAEDKTTVIASSSKSNFASNKWEEDVLSFTLDAETTGYITFGGYAENKGSGDHARVFFDNITIERYADALSRDVALLNAEIAKAQNVADAGLAPTTELAAAIATAQGVADAGTDSETVLAAIETLQAAVATYNELNTHFVALADFKAYFVADPYTYASEESKTNYNTLAAKTPANAEEADANLAELQLAARAIAESHAKAEGVVDATDQTSVIVNPNAEAMDGWTTVKGEGSGGKLEVKSGEPFTDAAGSTDHPYFDGGDWGANAWDVTLQQTVNLPKGKYMLSATSRASTDMASFALFAGEARTEMPHVGASGELFNRGYNLSSVEFEVTEETADVNIGVQGVAAVKQQWMSFTRFQLVKLDKSETVDPEPEPQPEPAIADGTYYLYNEAGKVFFERGGLYGTQAVVGKYGLPVDITTVDGATTLAMHDWAGTVIGFDEGIYADASGANARTYTVKPVEGGFVFVNNNNYALTIVDGAVNGVLEGEGTVWAVKTLEERNAILDAAVAADKSAAIAAAGYPEDVEFETTDCTEQVASASLAESIEGWTWTEERGGNNATNEYGTERYQATGTLSQTVTGLEPGLYRVTVNGLYRDGSNKNQVLMAADGYYNSTAYLAANGVQAQITPWAKDCVAEDNPNSMADYKAIIDEDATKYLSELYTTVGEEGEMAISINIPSYIGGGWCIFSNVTLTRLSYTAPEPEPTLPEDGTYYVKNVATGKYLAGGSWWGTHAVVTDYGLDFNVALADGKYTLDSNVAEKATKNYLNGEYIDGYSFGWTLIAAKTSADADAVIISNGENNLTAQEGGLVTLDTSVEDNAKWVFVSVDEFNAALMAELATATEEDGKDATMLVKAQNFGRNDLRNSAWEGAPGIGGAGNDANANSNAEKFNCTYDVYQTVTVPNGKYTVEMQGFYRNGNIATAAAAHVGETEQLLATLYANSAETQLPSIFSGAGTIEEGSTADGIEGQFPDNQTQAGHFFNAGAYNVVLENVIVVDGTLKIGVKKSEAVAEDWTCFDNVRLTYYGEIQDLTIYKEAYETALAAAQAALADEANAVVTGEERTALDAAIKANTTVEETKDAYVAATTALNEAAATFKAATAAYQALEDARVAYAFDANAYPYASSTKLAVLNEALAATATNATEAQTMTGAIVVAARDYVESNAVAEEQGAVDFTENIVNPNAENGMEGWTVSLGEGSGGKIGVLNGEPFTDAAGSSTHSYFDGGNWDANAWDVSVSQEVTLPSGEYLLTVTSRASSDMASFQLFANDESVEMKHVGNVGELFDRGWNDCFLVFNVHEDNAPVAIGVQGVADVLHQWMSFTRFRLVRLGDANIINGIQTENLDNATIYSVNGQVVRTNATTTKGLAKGIYVVNGKKVVVK